MNISSIREMLSNGFKPFTMHLSDGRAFPVPHSNLVAVGKNVVVVIGKHDRVNTLDPLHITSIDGEISHP